MPLALNNQANLYVPYQAAGKLQYNKFKKNCKTKINIYMLINNQMLIDICKINNKSKNILFMIIKNSSQNIQQIQMIFTQLTKKLKIQIKKFNKILKKDQNYRISCNN